MDIKCQTDIDFKYELIVKDEEEEKPSVNLINEQTDCDRRKPVLNSDSNNFVIKNQCFEYVDVKEELCLEQEELYIPVESKESKLESMSPINLKTTPEILHGEKPYPCGKKKTRFVYCRKRIYDTPLKCELCQYVTNSRFALRSHVMRHNGEKPFSCNICSGKFIQKYDLKRHLLTHNVENDFHCNLCDYKGNAKRLLLKHIYINHANKRFRCSFCNYGCYYKSSFDKHMYGHTNHKTFQCPLCEYKTSHKGGMGNHVYKHTGEAPFNCTLCDYESVTKFALAKHIKNWHIKQYKYHCDACGFEVSNKELFHRHRENRHLQNRKLFACKLCGCTSRSKCSFNQHYQSHLRGLPQGVSQKTLLGEHAQEMICESKDRDDVAVHVKTHIKQEILECALCDFKCGDSLNLTEHNVKTHTWEKLNKCSVCDFKFATASGLSIHIKRRHSQPIS